MYYLSVTGEFGVVYRATVTNWRERAYDVVAVKTLKGKASFYPCSATLICWIIV